MAETNPQTLDRDDAFDADDDYESDDASSFLTLDNIRAFLWRQRYILIGVTSAALVIGLVGTLLMKPLYQATSLVRVDYNQGDIVAGQDLTSSYLSGSEVARYLETQAGEIRSRSLALSVIDDLGLASNDRLMGATGEQAAEGGEPEAALAARREAASEVLMANLTVEVPFDSRIISIRYSAEDPALAADISNAYARAFLTNDVERSLEAYSYAREYLEGQITETREALRDAEILANQYARRNAIVGLPIGNTDSDDPVETATLTASNLAEVNSRYIQARNDMIAARQRWESVSNVPALQLAEVQRSSSVQQLRARLGELNVSLADLLERYQDDHPEVREVRAEIAAADQSLSALASDIKNTIRTEYQTAQRQAAALRGERDRVSEVALDEQDRRVQYNLLARDADAYRVQLAALLQRYNEISSAANLQSNQVTLLDYATVPRSHYSPNLFRNLLIALILGGGAAMGLALLREILDDRLRTAADIERCLGIPAFGQTPHVDEAEIAEQLDDPFSAISEAYSSVRATLDFALPSERRHVIQFTSSQPFEGKTTSALAIASRYASVGKKVLLVDVDLRRQSLAKRLTGASPKNGLISALFGRAELPDLLLPQETENLHVLPTGESPPNPVEILSSGLMSDFLAKQREAYDVIILDGPPVMGLADAPLLSRFADCTVFVAEANRVEFGKTRRAVRRLKDAGADIAGAILTKYRALEAGENYNYQYRYYTYSSE